jgi:thiamine biosynthesis protein ThiC
MKEEAQIGEAKVGPSHDEIMKAIGHTQSSAQGMAILQKKFKLTPQQARKHMDMFLKDDVQIDEISMTKMADYAPKAVKSRNDAKSATSSADSNRRATAKKILDKRKTGANNYNKKMWGYGKVAPTK